MSFWDGNKNDISNFPTDKYLKLNSCGYQNPQSEHTVVRKNGRVDYHILMIISGMCEALHDGKTYTLTDGNMIVYAPGEEQKYVFKAGCTSVWCHFTGSIVKEVLEDCNIHSGVYFTEPNKIVIDTFSRMIQRYFLPEQKKLTNASLIELLYNISSMLQSSEQKGACDAILPVLTYINANYNKQITLDELAEKTGYSKSRFSHIFSESTGTTPVKYQNDIRLKMSCEMLLSTSLTVAEIAVSCGFNDPLYYSKMFKKRYGMSPTEYRLSASDT